MAVLYPTTLDSFTNPTGTDATSAAIGSRTHSQMHADINDIIEYLEAKVGVDSSAVTTSHDYKLGGVTGTDKAASLTGTEALSGKTLTAPKIANGGYIADANGNEEIIFTTTASAVNEITLANGATGVGPTISASGETNVDINLQVKGTGVYNLKATASGPTDVRLYEDTDNGTNYVSVKAPSTLASNFVATLPAATGTIAVSATAPIAESAAGDISLGYDTTQFKVASNNLTVSDTGYASVYRATDQASIANLTWTKVQYATEVYDIGGNYDNATNYRYTVPTGGAGKYQIAIHNLFSAGVVDGKFCVSAIYKNGVLAGQGRQMASIDTTSGPGQVVRTLELADADYIEGYVIHNFGGNGTLLGDVDSNFMCINRLAT